ncbi:unnamed protein product [Coregonus sp. 'balchen']|nr:unnamed protein product [Coregonus sp. 'balchen']
MWSQEQTGQHYNITSPESDSYTCEARNPVSEKTQTYNSNDCLATVEYHWSWPDHQGEMWSQDQTGQHYNITFPESGSYTCEARNPVSEKTQIYNRNDCLATACRYTIYSSKIQFRCTLWTSRHYLRYSMYSHRDRHRLRYSMYSHREWLRYSVYFIEKYR